MRLKLEFMLHLVYESEFEIMRGKNLYENDFEHGFDQMVCLHVKYARGSWTETAKKKAKTT